MRTKHTFRLPPDLAAQLADYAGRRRVPQALVVETALASYLSPDNSERMEAALGRRLDRLTRQVERLERHAAISNEALALFVRLAHRHAAAAGHRSACRPGQGPRALRGFCRGTRTAAGQGTEPGTGNLSRGQSQRGLAGQNSCFVVGDFATAGRLAILPFFPRTRVRR